MRPSDVVLVLLISLFVNAANQAQGIKPRWHKKHSLARANSNFMECGIGLHNNYTARIIGGRDAKPGEFPFQVFLKIEFFHTSHMCTGSIIDEWHILTAAHCVLHEGEPPETIAAIMGSTNVHENKSRQVREVVSGIAHKGYSAPPAFDDIALLRVDRPIKFGVNDESLDPVASVCLPEDEHDRVEFGTKIVAVGWGNTDVNGSVQAHPLQTVELRTLTEEETDKHLEYFFKPLNLDPSTFETLKRSIKEQSFFVKSLVEGGNSTICKGDSGGPALKLVNGKFKTVGIASSLYNLDGPVLCSPGTISQYMRVSYYRNWIESAKRIIASYPQCGTGAYTERDPRAAPNNLARAGEFPFLANVFVRWRSNQNGREEQTFCNGALMDNWNILTAAHCVAKCNATPVDIQVHLGEHSFSSWSDGQMILSVSNFTAGKYDPCRVYTLNSNSDDDLAVLRLERRIEFRLNKDGFGSVNRICLATYGMGHSESSPITVVGYTGVLATNDWKRTVVQQGVGARQLKITERGSFPGLDISNAKMYLLPVGEGGQSSGVKSIHSDGWPAAISIDGRYYLTGIASTFIGDSALGSATMFSRIEPHYNWIKNASRELAHSAPRYPTCGLIRKGDRKPNLEPFSFEAGPGSLPHMAILRFKKRTDSGGEEHLTCAGSLIDDRHILTAASCVEHCNGKTLEGYAEFSDAATTRREIVKGVTHQYFRCDGSGVGPSNVAVLKLGSPVEFRLTDPGPGFLNKICLPQPGFDLNPDDEVVLASWQPSQEQGPKYPRLWGLSQLVMRKEDCERALRRIVPDISIRNDQFCVDRDKRDTRERHWKQDIGQPAMKMHEDEQLVVVGIKSSSFHDHHDGPELYTRVAGYLNWIDYARTQT